MKKLNVVAIGLCFAILIIAGVPSTVLSAVIFYCFSPPPTMHVLTQCGSCPIGYTAHPSTIPCTTAVNGVCGPANGLAFSQAPTSGLCSAGNAGPVSTGFASNWFWSCAGSNGGTTASCEAYSNPVCGSANGQSFTTAPTTNLCSFGVPTAVLGTGPWTWDCEGEISNGAIFAGVSCQANYSGSPCFKGIISGTVSATGVVLSGTGFTATQGTSGYGAITFTTPFCGAPSCVFSTPALAWSCGSASQGSLFSSCVPWDPMKGDVEVYCNVPMYKCDPTTGATEFLSWGMGASAYYFICSYQ